MPVQGGFRDLQIPCDRIPISCPTRSSSQEGLQAGRLIVWRGFCDRGRFSYPVPIFYQRDYPLSSPHPFAGSEARSFPCLWVFALRSAYAACVEYLGGGCSCPMHAAPHPSRRRSRTQIHGSKRYAYVRCNSTMNKVRGISRRCPGAKTKGPGRCAK